MADSIPLPSGGSFKFAPPVGQDLPTAGFTPGETVYYPRPMPEPQSETDIVIAPDSQRLEILEPFASPFAPDSGNPRGLELPACKVLMRVRGKCTTDHISAAVCLTVATEERVVDGGVYRGRGSSTRDISQISLRTFVSPETWSSNALLMPCFVISDYCRCLTRALKFPR